MSPLSSPTPPSRNLGGIWGHPTGFVSWGSLLATCASPASPPRPGFGQGFILFGGGHSGDGAPPPHPAPPSGLSGVETSKPQKGVFILQGGAGLVAPHSSWWPPTSIEGEKMLGFILQPAWEGCQEGSWSPKFLRAPPRKPRKKEDLGWEREEGGEGFQAPPHPRAQPRVRTRATRASPPCLASTPHRNQKKRVLKAKPFGKALRGVSPSQGGR